MSSCWVVVGLLSRAVIGWQDWHDVVSYTKTRQAPSWPIGHVFVPPSSRHNMMSHALQSLLDQSFPVSGYFSGKYHTLFITWSFSIMLYHPPSHTMSYAPILTHLQTNFFPMTMFSLCPCWFIRSHDPLHFLNDLTNHSHPPSCLYSLLLFYLWLACLWSFCHGHSFCTWALLGSVAGAPQLCNC